MVPWLLLLQCRFLAKKVLDVWSSPRSRGLSGLDRSVLPWNWAGGLSAVESLKHAKAAGGSSAPRLDLISLCGSWLVAGFVGEEGLVPAFGAWCSSLASLLNCLLITELYNRRWCFILWASLLNQILPNTSEKVVGVSSWKCQYGMHVPKITVGR